ncbi:hypothetical protein PULV_a3044 [Pseudoalteromonas ulvae UL12]|nr:hypothetical protein [Pseudoalteromonas ulvae UL12]
MAIYMVIQQIERYKQWLLTESQVITEDMELSKADLKPKQVRGIG